MRRLSASVWLGFLHKDRHAYSFASTCDGKLANLGQELQPAFDRVAIPFVPVRRQRNVSEAIINIGIEQLWLISLALTHACFSVFMQTRFSKQAMSYKQLRRVIAFGLPRQQALLLSIQIQAPSWRRFRCLVRVAKGPNGNLFLLQSMSHPAAPTQLQRWRWV